MANKKLRTAELAAAAGISPSAVRYYEQRGLLPDPGRSASGYRLYPSSALATLEFIKRAQLLGFKLREIKELLSLRSGRGCKGMCELAEQKSEHLADEARRAQAARKILADLVRLRPRGAASSATCPVGRYLEGATDVPRRRNRGS